MLWAALLEINAGLVMVGINSEPLHVARQVMAARTKCNDVVYLIAWAVWRWLPGGRAWIFAGELPLGPGAALFRIGRVGKKDKNKGFSNP